MILIVNNSNRFYHRLILSVHQYLFLTFNIPSNIKVMNLIVPNYSIPLYSVN